MGLITGILATSIVQSSSVTTSLIVGLVAAPENALPLANAVPMVMGANFGTTVTNTVVSLAHLRQREEFRRAFAVSTCDDFFEILSVCLILPLEWATGFLERSASFAAGALVGFGGAQYTSPLEALLNVVLAPIRVLISSAIKADGWQGLTLILFSVLLVFGALLRIVSLIRNWTGPSVEHAYPIVLGANVGTTVTALMAALAASRPNAQAGIAIAIVHTLYNLTGTAIFLPFGITRQLALGSARWLSNHAADSPLRAITYVTAIFYGFPAAMAGLLEWLAF